MKSGQYAEQFEQFNVNISRCLDSLSFNVSVRNEERRQQDMSELSAFIKVSYQRVLNGVKDNIKEEQLSKKLLDEVKEVAYENKSIMETFLKKMGHDSKLVEAELEILQKLVKKCLFIRMSVMS